MASWEEEGQTFGKSGSPARMQAAQEGNEKKGEFSCQACDLIFVSKATKAKHRKTKEHKNNQLVIDRSDEKITAHTPAYFIPDFGYQ